MRSGRILVPVFLFLVNPFLKCQTVGIEGTGTGYDSKELRFFVQSDPVSKRERPIFRLTCSDSGFFSCEIPVEDNRLIYIKSGIYSMPLYVMQDKQYKIRMPDYLPRPAGEEYNPFYIETTVIPEVVNDTNDKNNFIRLFDAEFNPLFNMVADRIALNYRVTEINSEIGRLNSVASRRTDPFSRDFAQFRLMMLNNVASGTYEGRIEDSALINRKFITDNQAYLELIEQKFTGYFRTIASGETGERFLKAFYSASLSDLRILIASCARLSEPQLLDYVILMNLYSEYYSGSQYEKPAARLIEMFKTAGASEYIKELASTLLENITSLLPGREPPHFSLPDISGQIISPDSLRGKFLLLSIARTNLTATMLEYSILKMWYTSYGDDLQVVTVVRDKPFAEAAGRMRDNGFGWILLDGTGSDILDYRYNVRMYPYFMLIDREGKIINNTCPMPSENLEIYFRSVLDRSKKALKL